MVKITDALYDQFIDDATHNIGNHWETVSGKKLTIDELYEINDLLTGYFNDQRHS